MNHTKIEWVKNPDGTQGYTWNPITGCLNGCSYCYARKLANGRLRSRYLANQNVAYCYYRGKELIGSPELLGKCDYSDPFYPRFWEDKLNDFDNYLAIDDYNYDYKVRRFKPKGIFTCDMSDLFGIGVPEEWTRQILTVIEMVDIHRFYLLTKQPQNLIKFSPFPDNCWVGVTATDDIKLMDAHFYLRKVDAKVKFVSIEPLLHWSRFDKSEYRDWFAEINWVIIGAQTSPKKLPKLKRVEEIIGACCKANIPYFLKDNLGDIIPGYSQGDKLHQEMPKIPN